MAQPTSISVVTDNVEYSRYENSHNTINVTVAITGGAPYVNEVVLVELVKARRSRDASVATATVTFTGTVDPQTGSASFVLTDIVDQDMINLVRHGKYYVRARSLASVASAVIGAATSTPITVSTLDTGIDANAWTVRVLVPSGTSPLSVVVVGTVVTVNLAVASSVPVAALNTREAIVSQISANYGNTIFATFVGTPGLSLSAAQSLTPFFGGRDDVVGSSSDFDVRIVTIERLKNDYLFGIPLYAGDSRFVKYQPTNITGAAVKEVSRTHPLGLFPLSYTYYTDGLTNATAAIGVYLGANGTVNITAIGVYEGTLGNALTVQVLLPGGTSSLVASIAGTVLTVSLAVVAGVPQAASNTATLIAAAISVVTGLSAVATGTGASSLNIAQTPIAFTGGTDRTIRQLSWNGGVAVNVNNPGTYILRRGGGGSGAGCAPKLLSAVMGQDYIVVRISGPTFLPISSQTDELLIQNRQIDDDSLGKYLCSAEDWLENVALAIYLEPTNVVTDRDPTTIQFSAGINSPNPIFTDPDYDFIVGPLTHFARHTSGWLGIQTPFMQMLRVDSLFGSIANTRVVDLDLDWVQFYPQGGLIQVVPFNQTIAFDFIGLATSNALGGTSDIPNFWHFNIIAGLRDTPCDLQELIAKKAAMDALMMLGAALRPGVGSVSLGRDGVSQSVSYTNQQKYGAYTGAISGFKDWIDEQLVKYKGRYRGSSLIVV